MSEDYGIKVSKAGEDVKTSTDTNTLFTTKYSIPKAVNWEEINLSTVGDPFNYPHRAEFIPFVLAYATADGGTDKVFASYYNYNDPDNVQIWISADENKIRVETSGTPDNKKVNIYAFVPEIDV